MRAVEIQVTSVCSLFRQFTRNASINCILPSLPHLQFSVAPSSGHPRGLQTRVLGLALIHPQVSFSLPGKEVCFQALQMGREPRGSVGARLSWPGGEALWLGWRLEATVAWEPGPARPLCPCSSFASQPLSASQSSHAEPTTGAGGRAPSAAPCN